MIVIHEIFGMTDWEPTIADRFAGKGYIAIAPDLLSSRYGMSPPTQDSGRKLVATLNDAGVIADLDATYKYVNALPGRAEGQQRRHRLLLGRRHRLEVRFGQSEAEGCGRLLRTAAVIPT